MVLSYTTNKELLQATILMDMIHILITEMPDAGSDRAQGRVAQGAEALAADVVADVEQEIQIFLASPPALDAV